LRQTSHQDAYLWTLSKKKPGPCGPGYRRSDGRS
jgi:hypothetical protein